MEFVEIATSAIELAKLVKEICDKVKSNKEKCGLLARLSDEVGSILEKHFGSSVDVDKWREDKVIYARVETTRFCLKNAEDLIKNYMGKRGFDSEPSIINAMNIDAKFQKVIDDLEDAKQQLRKAIPEEGNNLEAAANDHFGKVFMQAADRDRQRDIATVQEELRAKGCIDPALQQKLEAVIELLQKQSAVNFETPSSSSSSSMRISVAPGKSDADYAYFITPECIEYDKKAKGDGRVKLGQGGFGTVYRAKLRRSLPVAVKVLDDSATNKDGLEELRREIRIMSCLSHPNIICFLGGYYPIGQTTHDDDEDEQEAYLVMELAENKSLAYHLGMLKNIDVRKLPKSTKVKILSGLADGLYYLHMQKIVHRDIKPDNVLLDREFVAKITDFGLAKVKASSVASSTKGGSAGTHGYQASEMIKVIKPSFPVDVWAFGVIMVECMIEERFFNGFSPPQIMDMVCSNNLPLNKIKSVESQWPKDYIDLAKKCLSWNPAKRPTAMDVSVVMRGIMEHSSSTSSYIESLDDKPDLVELVSSVTLAPSPPPSTSAPKMKILSLQETEDLYQSGQNFQFGTNGIKVDYARAVDCYLQVEDYKHPGAQCNLGVCYYNGHGVPQDFQKAIEYFLLAANQRHAAARNWLGYCYKNGQGVPQSNQHAIDWFTLAANQGNVDSQNWLGYCYQHGHGVAIDLEKAKGWYQLAADQGNEHAKSALLSMVPAIPELELASGRQLKKLDGHTSHVNSVCWSPDGRLVASGSSDKMIRMWEVASGREVKKLDGHTNSVISVCWSPDGKLVASGSSDNSIRVWEVASGREVKKLDGHTHYVYSVCWSPDGKLVASGSLDNSIRVWEVASGREVKKLDGHTDWVRSVCWSPDGKLVASGSSDNSIRVWEVASGREVKKLDGHTNSVISVCWSPDGKLVASGSSDNSIRVWEVASGREVKKLDGHTNSVLSVCWSPDGKLVASGSYDKSTRVWEVASGREVKKLEGHTNGVYSVCWSPDGKLVASGSDDKSIRVWEVRRERN